jgi:hypothetical protein
VERDAAHRLVTCVGFRELVDFDHGVIIFAVKC